MKVKILILVLLLLLLPFFNFAQVHTLIPDNNFENYLETHSANGNTVAVGDATSMGNGIANDNKVFTNRISLVTTLNVQYQNITDLTGIEGFTSLSVLSSGNNQLTTLDVSQNTALTMFACNDNQLTSLNLKNGNNTAIVFLNTTINPNLACIEVDDATWSAANWSGYVDATSLFSEDCTTPVETHVPDDNFENYLETHDANGNTVSIGDSTSMGNGIANDNYVFTLRIIGVLYLNVSAQSISNLTGIEDFNSLTNLDCSDNQLNALNIQGNPSLTNLNCSRNELNGLYIAENLSLTNVDCSRNELLGIYLASNTALSVLNCSQNLITHLDLTQNTALNQLRCFSNPFNSGLNVSQNTNLVSLYCSYNNLNNLDVSRNTNLGTLRCSNNNLNDLDVSQNTNLAHLYCISNSLNNLDVSQNTALYTLRCESNNIGSMDLTNSPNLYSFYCNNNNLAFINITQNINLEYFYCSYNQLGTIGSNLDLTNNISLKYFSCNGNNLNTLDISNNINLINLRCHDNNLTSLDVSLHADLRKLHCQYNQLTSLNIKNGNNTNLINAKFKATNNSNLTCIEVDNATWSTANWTNIDSTASFSANCTAAVNEHHFKNSFSIYPNPASNNITLKTDRVSNYKIFNISGQILSKGALSEGENNIATSNLINGVYFIKIDSNQDSTTLKLIIKN